MIQQNISSKKFKEKNSFQFRPQQVNREMFKGKVELYFGNLCFPYLHHTFTQKHFDVSGDKIWSV